MRMKKAAAVLLSILMLCSLTGCNEVKEMKKYQAFWVGEEFGDKVEWNGHLYKRSLSIQGSEVSFTHEIHDRAYYITEKDVPALLQSSYGTPYSISKDESMIFAGYETAYVREDVYDAVEKALSGNAKTVWYVNDIYQIDMFENVFRGSTKLSDEDGKRFEDWLADKDNVISDEAYANRFFEDSVSMIYSVEVCKGKVCEALPDLYLSQNSVGSLFLHKMNDQYILVLLNYADDTYHLMSEEDSAYFKKLLFPQY